MLEIYFNNKSLKTDAKKGQLLSKLISDAGIMLDLRCGGSGICGRCKVTLLSGTFSIKDKVVEVRKGEPVETFSCRTTIESDNAKIVVPVTSVIHSDGQIAVDFDLLHLPEPDEKAVECKRQYGLAIDIGTTTVAAALLDHSNNKITATVSAYNNQSLCGDNVSSRISYCAGEGGIEYLRSLLINDTINPMVRRLLSDTELGPEDIVQVSISGNTVMSHLFLGISPESIGILPFEPAVRIYPVRSAGECGLEINQSAPVNILPSISGYIGGDLTAGIMVSELYRCDGHCSLLIDIGTNCEIILNNGKQLYASAAAAGPAFEGAGILCGSRAASGAIDHISINENLSLNYTTIGNEVPAGICGSALVDFIADGFSSGLLDSFGRYDLEKLKKSGNYLPVDYGNGLLHAAKIAVSSQGNIIYISEADIEQALKAKAAVYSGIISLLSFAGITIADINVVHLAGGFARYLNLTNAVTLGMLPPFKLGKVLQIGNSSLAGAVTSSADPGFYFRSLEIIDLPQVVALNQLPDFENTYIDALMIPNFDTEKFYGGNGQ